MATIYIDNVPYEVKDGLNLLHACLSLGFDIPHFCWHPALHSVGACRLCAVKEFKDEKDTRGRLIMSCMTDAKDGVRISIDDPEAREFRARVIEWLMLNHPHDCPVCDEGGECHLQDMTVMTGHNYRRTRFKKRTHRNQDLGPFINHEMNRCIQCYRCVRFYQDYAGGHDLDAFGSHDHVYFGRHEDGPLESEFSGNLVEVCPTGVFTDKTLKRHYTRKWDLQTAPSICVHCGLGCNIIPGERYGTLRRILNRYNGAVNGYFLCDRGRFGYEFVNDPGRLREPLLKKDAALEPVSREEILHHAGGLLASGNRVIGIGSPRASLEANFALRTLVGPDNFYAGVSETEHRLVAAAADILRKGPCRSLSLREVETADSVLILGEDATNTAPMLALALRQAVLQKPREATAKEIAYWNAYGMKEIFQDERGPFFIAAPDVTRLDEVATQTYHAAPDDIARLGFLIAQEIDAEAEAAVGAAAPAPPSPERMARALGCFLADQLEREETGKGGSGLHEKTLPETVASALKEGGCPAPGPAGHAPLARRIADALGGLIAEATAHPETDKTEASLLARLVKALKNTKTPTPEEASELSQWLSKALEVLIAEALKAAPEPAPDVAPPPKAVVTLAHRIARALKAAKRPLVVSGTGAGSEAVLQGAANVARALHKKGKEAGIFLVVPECNSLGLGLMAERHLEDALETVEHGGADACLVLENDLYRRMETPKVDRLLNGTKHVILLDHTWSPTAERADAVLPAAAFAESDGTLVNNEGRSQRFFQVYPPEGEIAPGWRWLGELLASYAPGAAKGWETLDGVTAALAEGMPVFGPVVQAAPGETFRAHGQKIPRQSHRFSGRTAMLANVTMHEPPPPPDPDSPLAFSMEGYEGMPPSALIPRYWAPGWNSAQAVNKFQQEIDGPLVGGDPGIRLLEPAGEPASEYFRTLPAPFGPRDDAWLLVPSHHIFGSEELSVRAPGILQRIPPPLLALNPSDAKRIGVIEGGEVELTASDTSFRLRVSLHPALPPGVAGVPAGVPGLDGLIPRGWGKMKKAGHD